MRLLRAVSPLVLLTALAVPLAAQQSAPPGRLERLHATPRTVWATRGRTATASLVAAARAARVAPSPLSPRVARIGLAGTTVVGTMEQLVIPVSFSDQPFTADSTALATHLYGAGSAGNVSVAGYYDEASRGVFHVHGTVLAPVTLPHPSSYYVGSRSSWNQTADLLPEFIADVFSAADAATDLWPYAGDGGQVAAVVILVAGKSGTCTGATSAIWPHRYTYSALTTTSTTPGHPYTSTEVTSPDPITLDDYIVQGSVDCDGSSLAPNGIVIHETGHLLGLPDLYDTNTGSYGPVGFWDLMSLGNYNTPGSPALMGAWSRGALGWLAFEQLNGYTTADTTAIELAAAQTGGRGLLLPVAGTNEFVLFETRTATGTDRHVPGAGLLAWYVDADRVADHLADNTVNTDPAHPGVAVLQADGRRDLEQRSNFGDAGDPFPGTGAVTSFTETTTPAFVSRQTEEAAGWRLLGITYANDVATFRVTASGDTPTTPGDGDLGSLTIRPDTLPVVVAGQTFEQALTVDEVDASTTPLAWSIDRAHTTLASATIDAATGVLRGTMPVSASSGLTVAVTVATADSTAAGARTYTLRVVPVAELPFQTLAAGLVGGGTALPTDVRAYYDAVGNHNGRYDLGDLVLAHNAGKLTLSAAQAAMLRSAR